MTLCFDITNYLQMPGASGIQRVLREVARRAATDDRFSYIHRGNVYLLAPATAFDLLDRPFRSNNSIRGLTSEASIATLGRVSLDTIERYVDAYVFAELTYDPAILAAWRLLSERIPDHVGAIFYDALPELSRSELSSQAPFLSGSYFRLMCRTDKVACISDQARTELAILARRDPEQIAVVPLGADHFPRMACNPGAHFAILGDLKNKKRTTVAIDAFRRAASPSSELIVIGRPIPGEEQIVDHLRAAMLADPRIKWRQSATDYEVIEILSTARGSIFVAAAEGYGLPAVESIQLGVPAVVDAALPCARYLDTAAVIKLDAPDVNNVSTAIRRLDGPEGLTMRNAARAALVPSWSDYVAGLRSTFIG